MLLLQFVLKTNYLHIRNELKAYVYYLCFLKYWQISIFLSYQISSPSMQTHLRSHIGRGACLWEGWFYQILSNIANHKDEPDGYWISRDLWQFGGKILHHSFNCFSLSDMSLTWQDNHQNWFLPTKKNHNHFMVDCISCTIHVSGWHSSRKKHASMTGLIWF